jgi:hypothetical protein
MTTTLTIRLPATLARRFKAKTRNAKANPSAVIRRAAAEYVRDTGTGTRQNAMQEHIDSHAGRWDGYLSGEELLQKTRPGFDRAPPNNESRSSTPYAVDALSPSTRQ